jgi:hypothetical protein
MAQQTSERNPFMLMINPEVILAAVEKSERLSQLNRHMCRPLDRPMGAVAAAAGAANDEADADADAQEGEGEGEGDADTGIAP